MRVVFERGEPNIENIAMLLTLAVNLYEKQETYVTEQIPDEPFIGRGREIRNKQRRPRSELHFNGIVVNHLLVACLRNNGFISRFELDDGKL